MFNWKKGTKQTRIQNTCTTVKSTTKTVCLCRSSLRIYGDGRGDGYIENQLLLLVFFFSFRLVFFSVCCWLSLSIECEKTAAKWISSVKHSMRCVYSWWAFGVCSCFSRRKMGDYSRNREQREYDCLSTHVKGFFFDYFPLFSGCNNKEANAMNTETHESTFALIFPDVSLIADAFMFLFHLGCLCVCHDTNILTHTLLHTQTTTYVFEFSRIFRELSTFIWFDTVECVLW